MSITVQYIYILLSYLLGAIPFGYLLTKSYTGKNIMKMGSGNVGSTNVGRIAGKRIGLMTQLLDMLKGFLPLACYLYFMDVKIEDSNLYIYAVALAPIIGHDFSLFLKFKGGKGVNTTLGAAILLAPYSVFFAVGIYLIIKWRLKFVSIGSIILGISLPITEFFFFGIHATFYYLLICMGLIVFLHRENINRLWNDEELPS